MTSIRESLRRLLARVQQKDHPGKPDQPAPEYAYRIFWTKTVRSWSSNKRHLVDQALDDLMSSEEFDPNPYRRRYHLSQVDDSKHSGASLAALKEVIQGFNDFQDKQEET